MPSILSQFSIYCCVSKYGSFEALKKDLPTVNLRVTAVKLPVFLFLNYICYVMLTLSGNMASLELIDYCNHSLLNSKGNYFSIWDR